MSDFPRITRRGFNAALAAGGLAAFGPATLRPATAATDVYWMGWQGYDECFHATDYLEKNDITFNTTYINSNEEVLTKLQGGGLGKYDVTTMYFGYMHLMAQNGLIEPIDEDRVQVLVEDKILPEFRRLDALVWDGRLWGIPWTWGTVPMMYDPVALPTPPARWKDLWDPKYQNKIVMIQEPVGTLYVWIPAITGNRTPNLSTHAQVKETIDALINLKKNHARAMAQSFGEAADMFARNEVTVSALGWEAMVGFAAEKGKTITFHIPEEGTMMFMDCLVIPARAPNRDVAYDLTNVCTSVEGQLKLAEILGQAVVNLDAISEVAQENRDMYRYDDMSQISRKATLHPVPPLEPDGTHATFDDMIEEYERLLRA